MFEYSGNIHIHSQYSDGGLSVREIASFARDAGLDFFIVNDHFVLCQNDEGYIDGVLVLQGMEVNDSCNHYLAMDIEKVIGNNVKQPQKVIDDVNAQNGLGIIAHPFEKGSPLFHNYRTYEWTDWSVHGFQGIEIWNYLSQWRDGITGVLRGIYLLFYPHAALKGPYRETMAVFDKYQKEGNRIVAFGGSDAHNSLLKVGPFKFVISPYDLCFKCINMHILTERELSGDFIQDKKKVYSALEKGNSWVAYDYFQNSRGFSYVMKGEDQKYGMGQKIPCTENMLAEVKTPSKARVVLIKDGREWKSSKGIKHKFGGIDKGVYRVEAYHPYGLGYRPWIFSNSIWVL